MYDYFRVSTGCSKDEQGLTPLASQTPNIFSLHVRFIQFTIHQSFLPSLVECHSIHLCHGIQQKHKTSLHYMFLELFFCIAPSFPKFCLTTDSQNSNLHLINSARLPGSVWIYSLEIASRQKARAIIKLTMVLFSQGSQS